MYTYVNIFVCTYIGQRSLSKSHNTSISPNKTGSARKVAALRQKLHGEKVRDLFLPFIHSHLILPNVK